MRRFYSLDENIIDNTVYFDKNESKHIRNVLRLEKGDEIIVSTGDGIDRFARLTSVSDACIAEIYDSKQNENEPACQLTLFQGIIKNEKMELLIQKACEIGVTKIVPVILERTVVKLDDKEAKKQERWQKIAREACKQCGRSRVPRVLGATHFLQAVEMLKACELKLVAYEGENTVSITRCIDKNAESIGYFIGAEGGIAPREHEAIVKAGAISVSLGRRILRAETAGIVAGAVILALKGEMDV